MTTQHDQPALQALCDLLNPGVRHELSPFPELDGAVIPDHYRRALDLHIHNTVTGRILWSCTVAYADEIEDGTYKQQFIPRVRDCLSQAVWREGEVKVNQPVVIHILP